MGVHKRHSGWLGAGRDGGALPASGVTGPGFVGRRAPQRLKPIVWLAALVALVLWTGLAWMSHAAVDPVAGWIGGTVGGAANSGRHLAAVTGIGKEALGLVDAVNAGGLLGQAIELLRVVAKPVIVILWALGGLAIAAAPFVLSRAGGMLARRGH